jgi:hypothetical protein
MQCEGELTAAVAGPSNVASGSGTGALEWARIDAQAAPSRCEWDDPECTSPAEYSFVDGLNGYTYRMCTRHRDDTRASLTERDQMLARTAELLRSSEAILARSRQGPGAIGYLKMAGFVLGLFIGIIVIPGLLLAWLIGALPSELSAPLLVVIVVAIPVLRVLSRLK